MLHVMLREYGPTGLKVMKSRSFASLGDLAHFFTSPDGDEWDSAEILQGPPETVGRVYSAETLREMAASGDRPGDL
jgi:hypothetical protein